MHTKHIRFRDQQHPGQPVAVGVALTVLIGAVLAVVGHDGPTLQPADLDSRAGQIIGTVTGTDRLNVRAVLTGQDHVDLADQPVTRLAAGAQVRILCQFTGSAAPGAGNLWYRISGDAVPEPFPGTDMVASAHYLDPRPGATVPPCVLSD